MAVFRVERNTGYTVMSNHHLRNKELSLRKPRPSIRAQLKADKAKTAPKKAAAKTKNHDMEV